MAWLVVLLVPVASASAQGWDWATYANSTATDEGLGIATDRATGEVYAVGASTGAISQYGISNQGLADGYLAKYKANGTLIWAFAIGSVAADRITDVVVDPIDHHVYITGYVSDVFTVSGRGGTPVTKTPAGGQDMFLAAFDSSGAVLWAGLEGGTSNDGGIAIAMDQNAIYVAGNYSGTCLFDGISPSPPSSSTATGALDWFVAKYHKTDGRLLWVRANQLGAGTQRVQAIAVDSAGVYFCGGFNSTVMRAQGISGNVNIAVTSAVSMEVFMLRLRRSDGLAYWGYEVPTNSTDDEGLGIAVQGDKLYLCGRGGGTMTFGPLAPVTIASTQNGFISRHDTTNGNAVWVDVVGNTGGAVVAAVNDVRIDETGSPWAGGFFMNQMRLPNTSAPTTTFTASGTTDLFLASLDVNGGLNRAMQAGGAGGDGVAAIAIYNKDKVYLTGAYSGSSGYFGTIPPTNLPFSGMEDIHVACYSTCNLHPDTLLSVIAVSNDLCTGEIATISIPNSQPGTKYTLVDSATGLAIGLTQVGTGGNLDFVTGPLSSNVTFTVSAYISNQLCTAWMEQTQSIRIHASPTPNLGPDITICPGVGVVLNPGGGYAGYSWNIGLNTPTVTVSAQGIYDVTVTDGFGCRATDAVRIAHLPLPIVGNIPDAIICPGESLTLTAAIGAVSYLWSTNETTSSILVMTPGNYGVTVTDGNGCMASTTMNLSNWAQASVSVGADLSGCMGYSPTITATPGFDSYLWNTGEITSSVILSAPGIHAVEATDNHSCISRDTMFLTWLPLPVVNLGPDRDFCMGDSALLDAGPGFASYQWNVGPTTQMVTADTSGSYMVTVTDGNGCLGSDQVSILVYAKPTPDLRADTTLCSGVALTLGSSGSYATYAWSTGASTATISVLNSGVYELTVTDFNGCEGSDTVVINFLPTPTPDLGPDTTICFGDSITLDAGSGYNSYAWVPMASTQTYTTSTGGMIQVTVIDSNGCHGSDEVTVGINPLPTPNLGPDVSLCFGDSITLATSGSYAVYGWSTGASTPTLTVDTAGSYILTVTDAQHCIGSDQVNVTVNALPVVASLADTTICPNDTIILTANSGNDTYIWSTGDTTVSISVSAAGTYSVTVSSASGCTDSASMVLSHYAAPSVSVGPDSAACAGQSIVVSATPGFAGYLWNTAQVTPAISTTGSGWYWVVATDTQGCHAQDSMQFSILALPSPHLGADTAICTGLSLGLDAGAGMAIYAWSTGESSQTILVDTVGDYAVTVTNIAGCQAADTLHLGLLALPTIHLGADTIICIGDSLQLGTVMGTGYHYLWDAGDTTAQVWAHGAGDYAVVVTDPLGCTGQDTLTLTRFAANPISLHADTAICQGDSLLLTVSGSYMSLLWQNSSVTDSIFAATAGTWSVEATDSHGCKANASMQLALNAIPAPQLGADRAICTGDLLTLHAGFAGTYLWSDSSTADSLVIHAAGIYSVTVTQSGCAGSDTMQLGLRALPEPSLGPDPQICPGDSIRIGVAPFPTALWSTAATTDSIWAMQAGIYFVAVTDSAGCHGSDTLILNFAPDLGAQLQNLLPFYCQTDAQTQLIGLPTGGQFGGPVQVSGLFEPATAGLGTLVVDYAYTDTVGCIWRVADTTWVTAPPSIADAGPDLVQQDPIILQATAPAMGAGHWDLGNLAGTLSDIHDPHAVLSTTAIGTYPIVWIVENPPCDPTRDTMYLMLSALSMPTGFSPNGDGVNDSYVISGISQYPDAKLSIYNRWGNLVWQSAHYHNEWTGGNADGQALVDDTYYAILEFAGKAMNTYVVLARLSME